jgi:hypothetical protein
MSAINKSDSSVLSGSCVYFKRTGPENTGKTLEVAAKRAQELGIQNVLVATTSGETGLMAAKIFTAKNLVMVTHSTGFAKPDYQEFLPEFRKKIEEAGAKILTCQHALGGVGRAVRKKLGTYELEEIIAYTLRIFGEGTKVAVEIALMAADAGFIPTSEPCISVGGTGSGADTAILLQPAHAQNFFDLRIMEILAKPRLEEL